MNNKDLVRLQHVVDSCSAIQEFIKNRTTDDLKKNRMLLSAITRELEIIGEAVNALSHDFKAQHNQIPWKDLIGMRNRLIHAYFNINPDIVWKTVTDDIPELLQAILKFSPKLKISL